MPKFICSPSYVEKSAIHYNKFDSKKLKMERLQNSNMKYEIKQWTSQEISIDFIVIIIYSSENPQIIFLLYCVFFFVLVVFFLLILNLKTILL